MVAEEAERRKVLLLYFLGNRQASFSKLQKGQHKHFCGEPERGHAPKVLPSHLFLHWTDSWSEITQRALSPSSVNEPGLEKGFLGLV